MCNESLRIPQFIMGDQFIRSGQDLRDRSIVPVQDNRFRILIFFVKIKEQLHVGAAPGVDRLIRVSDNEEVSMQTGKRFCNAVLLCGDILEFIYHDIFAAVLPFVPDIRIMVENIAGEIDQVIEIQAETFLLFVDVTEEDLFFARGGV